MFQSSSIVEISLGCKVVGNNSNIPAPSDSGLDKIHANSPDGIGVVSYYTIPGSDAALVTTDIATQMDALHAKIKSYTVVFEFKSTVSRIPTDEIPTIYLPQVWSGLICVPIADFALFVDVVYRLCGKDDLLSNPNFCYLKEFIGSRIYKVKKFFLTSSYVINKKCVEKIFNTNTIFPINQQIDSYLSELATNYNLNIYVHDESFPYFEQSQQFPTDIQESTIHELSYDGYIL